MSNEFPVMWNHYIEFNHAESSFLIMYFFLQEKKETKMKRGIFRESFEKLRTWRKKEYVVF